MKIGFHKMNSTDQILKLRKVRQEDCEILWRWANDPIVRAASFSSEPITWNDHIKWLNNKLNSSNCYQFIGVNNENRPIGQIRFDIDFQLEAEVDISIAPNERGKGYANDLIKSSIKYLFENTNIKLVNAIIKSENISSIKSFSTSGFECIAKNIVKNEFLIFHYTCTRSEHSINYKM